MSKRPWLRLGVITLALAALLHVLIVWLVPFAITSVFMSRVAAQAGYNRILTPPLPTDTARQIVKPSPDLLYALCVYDVSGGMVRITAKPPASYWSLSLYDRNTDNYFKINAAAVKGDTVDLILGAAPDAGAAAARFPAATYVRTPRATGVMLARMLVLDPASAAAALETQKTIRCAPLDSRG